MPGQATYSVTNWADNFETAESRKRKHALQWVSMPTKHDGRRYRRITKHPRAIEIFGAWCLIVQIAAKMPTRGLLVDDRNLPLSAEDMADMTGFPADAFSLALEVLSSQDVGWISAKNLPESAGVCRHLPEPTRDTTVQDSTLQDSTQQVNTQGKCASSAAQTPGKRAAPAQQREDPPAPVGVDPDAFPVKDGQWSLPDELFNELDRAYPKIDVEGEVQSARMWCIANPSKRKTAKGMPRFLNAWMSRAAVKAKDNPWHATGCLSPDEATVCPTDEEIMEIWKQNGIKPIELSSLSEVSKYVPASIG